MLSPCLYSFLFSLWKKPVISLFLYGKDWLILKSTVPLLIGKKRKRATRIWVLFWGRKQHLGRHGNKADLLLELSHIKIHLQLGLPWNSYMGKRC